MKKVTLKAYAVKHKLSLFNVVKMVKSGQIPSETVGENGRETVYILLDDAVEEKVNEAIIREENKEPLSLSKENERLKVEIQKLKAELLALKNGAVIMKR